MSKSPEAFRTISEVSEDLGVPAHVLRFWESKFSQVKPMKRGGGRRYYRPHDVALLRGVRELLYTDGMTIKGVQKVFREKSLKSVISRGSGEAETIISPAPGADGTHAPTAPEGGAILAGDVLDEGDLHIDAGSLASLPAEARTGSSIPVSGASAGPIAGVSRPRITPENRRRIESAVIVLTHLRDRLRNETAPG